MHHDKFGVETAPLGNGRQKLHKYNFRQGSLGNGRQRLQVQ